MVPGRVRVAPYNWVWVAHPLVGVGGGYPYKGDGYYEISCSWGGGM